MMDANRLRSKVKPAPDFNLLLQRLEQQIIKDENPDKVRRVINNEKIWRSLNLDHCFKWAELAQMAGESDIARKIYSHINQQAPEITKGWQYHLALLFVLNKTEAASRVLALARKHVDETEFQKWMRSFGPGSRPSNDNDGDIDAAIQPFDTMRSRRDSLTRFLRLFSGREDCFARQWVNKQENKQGYVPVRRPISHQDLEDHFKGTKTYGIYLIQSNGAVQTAVIDMDMVKGLRTGKQGAEEKNRIRRELYFSIKRLPELSQEEGLEPIIEFSGGKGYHFWYLFSRPVNPEKVRRVLEKIKQSIIGDLTAFNIEIFPKQDHLKGKGLGNLVKLPLGVHRLTGKRSYFVNCHARSVDAQLDYLSTISPVDPLVLDRFEEEHKGKKVFIHPRWESYAKSYPELHDLERLCPPIAQILASCRQAGALSVREEKIVYQTIGFLPRAKTLLHYIFSSLSDYNPHLVDYRLSRLRGTPVGCRRIHSLLGYTADLCRMDNISDYQHPLLHLEDWKNRPAAKSEKAENLSAALENLKTAIIQAQKFITP